MIHVPRQLVRYRRRVREWGRRHPRTLALLERIGCMRFDRGIMARGVAIGLFIALTPTVGLQTVLMLVFCLLLRGNFPVAFAVSWISNPITLGPLYLGYYLVGERVVSPLVHPLSPLWEAGSAGPLLEGMYLLVGSMTIAIPIAAGGYLLSYWLAFQLRQRRSA
jgi:uncharacterized protein (DUF2062 family)